MYLSRHISIEDDVARRGGVSTSSVLLFSSVAIEHVVWKGITVVLSLTSTSIAFTYISHTLFWHR